MSIHKKLAERFFSDPISATVMLDGTYTDVRVEAGYQPREDDVNVSEGVELYTVLHADQGDIVDLLTRTQQRELESEILGQFQSYLEGYFDEAADHARQARIER